VLDEFIDCLDLGVSVTDFEASSLSLLAPLGILSLRDDPFGQEESSEALFSALVDSLLS